MSDKREVINIAGLYIDKLSVGEGIKSITKHLDSSDNNSICLIKPYVKFFTAASKDPALATKLNKADLALADGISVQWAASYLYGQPKLKPNLINLFRSLLILIHRSEWISQVVPEKGAGVDATAQLLQMAEKRDYRVGVISGRIEQSKDTKANIAARFKGLNFLEVWPGYFDSSSTEETAIINQVKKAKLDILFVGRGFPLQEEFIIRESKKHLARVLIAEGGTFDYDQMGGSVKRAPEIWRRLGLEWLWRSLTQPKKLSSLFDVLKFIGLIYSQAKKQK